MPHAIMVRKTGGPEVLEYGQIDRPSPGPGELLVDVAAAGVNFIDTYMRDGIYPRELPFVPGMEGAGTVAATGEGVEGVAVGDRVVWMGGPSSYADQVVIPAASAVRVPDGIDDETAAAALLQGVTAHYLVISTYPVKPGDIVLIHAAAGGTGALLVQLAKARGARVIATVSTVDKERLARAAGADEVIRYTEADFVAETRRLTGGKGVEAVYDGVGRTTFDGSLASLAPRGMLVLFGAASGPVPPLDPQQLRAAGSVYLTRPTTAHYTATPEELRWRAGEIFDAITQGTLSVRVGGRYALADAGRAHEDLQSRRTTGKLLLITG